MAQTEEKKGLKDNRRGKFQTAVLLCLFFVGFNDDDSAVWNYPSREKTKKLEALFLPLFFTSFSRRRPRTVTISAGFVRLNTCHLPHFLFSIFTFEAWKIRWKIFSTSGDLKTQKLYEFSAVLARAQMRSKKSLFALLASSFALASTSTLFSVQIHGWNCQLFAPLTSFSLVRLLSSDDTWLSRPMVMNDWTTIAKQTTLNRNSRGVHGTLIFSTAGSCDRS